MRVAIPLSLALLVFVQAAVAQDAAEALLLNAPVETVTAEAPKAPSEKAIAGFVQSFAAPSMQIGKIPRWASGICPATVGLTPGLNLGVSALLKRVGAQVGAPVATATPCNTNVMVIFTHTPPAVLDDLVKNHEELLGYHEIAQTTRLGTMRYPIQSWYATATRSNNGTLIADSAQQSARCTDASAEVSVACGPAITISDRDGACFVAVQSFIRHCGGTKVSGSRIADGARSEFRFVTVIVDANRLGDAGIKAVANYVAMLALTQTGAFETCQPLVSIVNVMTPGCDEGLKPETLSPADLAYLSALYRMNPDVLLQGQRSSIAHQMETALGGH